jgi:hypothetical protein
MKFNKILLLSFLFILNSCSSCKTGTGPSPISQKDYPVVFSVNVDLNESGILAVIGTSQVINVNISSQMPTAGLTIDVTVTKDADNSIIYTKNISTVSSENIFTITELKPGVLCTAIIVVTSKSSQINTKTVSFKLAAK